MLLKVLSGQLKDRLYPIRAAGSVLAADIACIRTMQEHDKPYHTSAFGPAFGVKLL